MANGPFLNENTEHESNIGKYRVAMGYTVVSLAKECGCGVGVMCSLSNGMTPPYYTRDGWVGKIRPYVNKLVDILQVPLDELFPRYFCDIERNASKGVLSDQLESLSVSEGSIGMASPNVGFNLCDVTRLLSVLSRRQSLVIRHRFLLGYTLDDLAEKIGVTKERVRQIEQKALRILRYHGHIEEGI